MKRIMCIDYGDVRVGIALTDPLQIIASGYKTIINNQNIHNEILSIINEKQVESIVIGIPFDQNSEIGDAAKKVLVFAESLNNYLLKSGIDLPLYEQDERYTTMDAIRSMKELKIKRDKKKNVVDQIAAANILMDFMKSKYKTPLRKTKEETVKTPPL